MRIFVRKLFSGILILCMLTGMHFLHKKSRPGGAAETGRREPPVGVWERIYSATVISSVRTTGCGAPSAVQVTVMTVPSGASFAIFS